MILSARPRKLLLSLHVLFSVGWIGALAAFLAHSLVGLWSADPRLLDSVAIGMEITAWLVILPLSVASVGTGLIQSLVTPWGLLRHYWVIFKLVLTTVATVVLLLKLGPITALAQGAGVSLGGGELLSLRSSLAFHAGGGLIILTAATLLASYKPAGLTSRELKRRNLAAAPAPRWVKATWVVASVVAAVVVAKVLLGDHGPAMHLHR
jgi:hypothetical protein